MATSHFVYLSIYISITWKLASWIINFQFALMMLRLNKVTPPVTKGSPTHPHPHRSPCEAGCWLYSSSRSISHRHGVAVACNWYREWRLEMMGGKATAKCFTWNSCHHNFPLSLMFHLFLWPHPPGTQSDCHFILSNSIWRGMRRPEGRHGAAFPFDRSMDNKINVRGVVWWDDKDTHKH